MKIKFLHLITVFIFIGMLAFLPILSIVISETDSYACKVDSSLMWGDISTLDDISGWIEVHVRDNELEAIIGANIEAKNESGTIIATGTTNIIGIATLTDLAPGWYDITVNKTGFYQQTTQDHINWPGDDDYLTFYLIPSIANLSYIEVTVKNTTGSFIANARISATRHEEGAPCRIGQTNGSGYYNITGLEKKRWYYLSVEAPGYLNESYTQYIDYEGAHYNLTFILAEKPAKVATLTVTVFDDSSNPIPTANLTVKDYSGAVWGRGFTDGSGEVKIRRNQIPGTYWIYASAFGYYQYTNIQVIIPDSPLPNINIFMTMDLAKHAPGTACMIINVTDIVTCASIPNALISLYNSSSNEKILNGWTNAEGTFNATGLYKGKHTLYVKYGGYIPYPALKQTTIKWNGENYYINIKLTPHNQPKMQPISPNTTENNCVPLNWTYSGIVAYYCLYRNTSWFADVSKMTPIHIIAPTTTYTDNITETDTYYYAVMPVYWIDDSPEPGPLSNVVSIFINYTSTPTPNNNTPHPPVPQAPNLDPIAPNPNADGSITLNWNDVPGATTYYVYRATLKITSVTGMTPLNTTTQSHYTDTLTSNGTYYYAIVAGNNSGTSDLSNCENVTVAILPLPPVLQAPQLDPIAPNPDADGTITLNWNDVPGAIIYYVYRATSQITSVTGTTPLNTTTQSHYTDTIPTNGTYYYVIVAGNSSGTSGLSNCENVTVAIPPSPSQDGIPGFAFVGPLLVISLFVTITTLKDVRKQVQLTHYI